MVAVMDAPQPGLGQDTEIATATGEWWVAYVKTNNEKAFAEEMAALGIPAYCPVEAVKKLNSQNRRIQILRPLFPSYAFVAVRGQKDSEDYKKELYQVRGNAKLVKRTLIAVINQTRFVNELSQIQRALALGPIERCGYLVPGARVRIAAGPYMGMEGVLERYNGNKVQLVCSQMQAGIIITVKDNLEPI